VIVSFFHAMADDYVLVLTMSKHAARPRPNSEVSRYHLCCLGRLSLVFRLGEDRTVNFSDVKICSQNIMLPPKVN